MAKPITLDTSGCAGVSTFERDLRMQNVGKRVKGMVGQVHDRVALDTAGLPTHRLAQTFQNTPRRPKGVELTGYPSTHINGSRLKTKKRYATEHDYINVFDTRWCADEKGRMALFLSRRPGYAHVETNPDKMDMIATFHRERALGHLAWNQDNLCNDLFLTGTASSNTMDVLKPLGNRACPYSNPDGPFETSPIGAHSARVDHLDRTCVPRQDAPHIVEGEETSTKEGKSRMRVIRERSHIHPRAGQMVGDNRPPQLAQISDDGWGQRISYRRAAVTAPWSKGSF